jgi:site-specific DNA recombinase
MRAAIYARYSTDLQSDRSVEDQIALCEQYAAREGLEIVARHFDRARSGGTLHGRDGLAAIMDAATTGNVDCVIVEALDRLSRDMEGLAAIHKRLTFAGVSIRAVHEGEVNTVLVGLRGLVGQLFREDNAQKIRRGLAGRVRDGRSAGGLAYGYRAVSGDPGARTIDADEAAIVRRIFAAFNNGQSPRAIARALNTDHVPAPRGREWLASTINGGKGRGLGIIRNPIYAGVLRWGRCRKIVHPDTGRRLVRANSAAAETVDAPHLAIITVDAWTAAQSRLAAAAIIPPEMQRRPKRLLSGLLHCGVCGGSMVCNGKTKSGDPRISCASHKAGGRCDNSRHFPLPPIERAVISGLREQLLHPDAVAEYVRALHEEQRAAATDSNRKRAAAERAVSSLQGEFDRVVDCIAKGWGNAEILGPRSTALHAELEAARQSLDALGEPAKIITLHPAAITHYRDMIARLERALARDDNLSDTARSEIRALVTAVTIHRDEAASVRLEISGTINRLLGAGVWPDGVQIAVVPQEGCRRYLQQPALPPLPFSITVAA